MSRNLLLMLIGVLAVVAAVAGYLYYQERQSGIVIFDRDEVEVLLASLLPPIALRLDTAIRDKHPFKQRTGW